MEAGPPRRLDALRRGTMSVNAALLEALRQDILNGNVAAGIKLKIPALCERYVVNPGAVREALSRLVSEGLVEFADQRGFKSTPVNVEGLRDITRIRVLIESEALVDAMRNGDARWEGDILATQHRLLRLKRDPESTEAAEWTAVHKEFHMALVAACTSPWLIRLHNLLYDQTERYRLISAAAGAVPQVSTRNVEDEHSGLVQAVIARDEKIALKLMESHLLTTARRVESAIRSAEQPGDQ